jgi:hypothetical protein
MSSARQADDMGGRKFRQVDSSPTCEVRNVGQGVLAKVVCPRTGTLRRPSGAVLGRSTLHSGWLRRGRNQSDDLCLWLALAAGATVERVARASTGPGPSSTKERAGLWLGRLIR